MSDNIVEARGLNKSFGSFQALKNASFTIPKGRIMGVIGANGAGKTTMLNAVLGLSSCDGDLKVLGLDPRKNRTEIMEDVCFIADVATLPKFMKVHQALDFVEGIHPKFNRAKAEEYLSKTDVPMDKKIRKLSKGMTTQLHLAIVMSVDAKLLVLDEPTLGLDIIFRKRFYSSLLEDYFDAERTIVVTTHQVEEIEHILTDVIFIRHGEICFESDMDALGERFIELMVEPGHEEAANALGPIASSKAFGKSTLVYQDVARKDLDAMGETRRLGLADVFVAVMEGEA